MVKHGVSHAVVVLVTVVAGEAITKTVLNQWPKAEYYFSTLAHSRLEQAGISVPPATLEAGLTLALFGFIWGVAFKAVG